VGTIQISQCEDQLSTVWHADIYTHTCTHRWVELGMKEEWEREGAGNEPEDWADVIVKAGNVCACVHVCVCVFIYLVIFGALCVADVIVKAGNVCVRLWYAGVCGCAYVFVYLVHCVCVC